MSSVFPFSPHSPVQSDLLYKTMRRLYLHAVSQTLSLRRTHLPHTSSGYLQNTLLHIPRCLPLFCKHPSLSSAPREHRAHVASHPDHNRCENNIHHCTSFPAAQMSCSLLPMILQKPFYPMHSDCSSRLSHQTSARFAVQHRFQTSARFAHSLLTDIGRSHLFRRTDFLLPSPPLRKGFLL